jgi:glycosyltransferase involved in cell wall biosynthesis
MNKRIIFIHSLNNFTGSPNILSLIIRDFASNGYNIDLITNKSFGFLSDIKNIKYRHTSYRWSKSKLFTLFLLIWSQIELFFIILIKYRNEKGVFYINTILPFGAAWACTILKKEIVYHVHENMQLPKPLYSIYRFTYKYCQQKSIFVSKYLQDITGSQGNSIVIYNSLSPDFLNKIEIWNKNGNSDQKNILMVGSLRIFKGIYEFIELSQRLPQFSFELVVSASLHEVENFKAKINVPSNLLIFSQQTNLHPFYQKTKVLLQLSHPNTWIETFGLTILEAMVYGIPAIVPNVGGPIELIDNGVNGFVVDPLNIDLLVEKVKLLMENETLYSKFSAAAIEKSKQFDHDRMINEIERYLNS